MILVFNLAAGAVAALSIGAAVAAHYAGFEAYRVVAGFAAMIAIGGALELPAKPAWNPRYFWIIPAWLVGLVGLGAALHEAVDPIAGYVTIGVAGAAFIGVLVHAYLRKPGGKWLAGIVGSGAVATGFQLIGYYRPEWKNPVLFGVNAAALITMIYCGVQLYRARRYTAPHVG